MSQNVCQKWGFTEIKWSNANWTWDECQIVSDLVEISTNISVGIDASTINQNWNPYISDLEKKEKLIRLICKVKGDSFDESKSVKDFKITVSDVKLVVKTVSDIDLSFRNE